MTKKMATLDFAKPLGCSIGAGGTTKGIVWRPNGDSGHLGYNGIVSVCLSHNHILIHMTRSPKCGYDYNNDVFPILWGYHRDIIMMGYIYTYIASQFVGI